MFLSSCEKWQKRLFPAAMVAQAANASPASSGMAVYFTHIWLQFVTLGPAQAPVVQAADPVDVAPSGQQGLGYTEFVCPTV